MKFIFPWMVLSIVWGSGLGWGLAMEASEVEKSLNPSISSPIVLLTEAQQIIHLTSAQAAQHYPVRLRGIITCLEARSGLFFIQDQTAGIYIYDPNPPPSLKRGHYVEIKGLSSMGLNIPVVTATNILLLGEGTLPAPKPVTAKILASGSEDSQWVEIEAVVRKEGEDWGHWLLQVASGDIRFPVRLLELPSRGQVPLVDAQVRFRGVAAAHYNNQRELTGFHLIVPGWSDVTVLKAPPTNAFDLPLRLGKKILAYTPETVFSHRIRVQGAVTLYQPGKHLFLRDSSGGLRIEIDMTNQVNPGDVVDVAGFPPSGTATSQLENAIYRKTGMSTILPPAPLSAGKGLTEAPENELVQMEGRLLDSDQVTNNWQLLLVEEADESRTFHALLPLSSMGGRPFYEPRGSKVRLTGVVVREPKGDQNKPRCELWLRSPSDIYLLERPYYWTWSRVLKAMGGGGLFLLGVFAWTRTVQHRVEQKTALLRKGEEALEERYRDLFENANDMIYSLDLAGRFESINQAGEHILGYNRDEIRNLSLAEITTARDRERVTRLLDQARQGRVPNFCELEVMAKDGCNVTLEVNFRLNYLEGQPCCLRGIARDITSRKRAEAALSRSESQLRQFIAERTRLGRDLHDGIIQSIYGVGLGLEDCRQLFKDQPSQAEVRLKHSLSALNGIIREIRRFIGELEPETFPGSGLADALQQLVASMNDSQSTQISCAVDSQIAAKFSSIQASQIMHIVREGLSNSLRHARAEKVSIVLARHHAGARLEIEDNGIGFNSQSQFSQGRGLRNMTARALEMGADLNLDSQPGRGTHITVIIPHLEGQDYEPS